MRTYTQFTREQRYQIYALLRMGHNQTEIAGVIGTHKSTVNRELYRNRGRRGYRPKQAHRLALSRRDHSRTRLTSDTWALIEATIRLDWSPEQIAGWLMKHHAIPVSHEWIYQHILVAKMNEVNAAKEIVRKLPSLSQVEDWVKQAKGLPRAVSY